AGVLEDDEAFELEVAAERQRVGRLHVHDPVHFVAAAELRIGARRHDDVLLHRGAGRVGVDRVGQVDGGVDGGEVGVADDVHVLRLDHGRVADAVHRAVDDVGGGAGDDVEVAADRAAGHRDRAGDRLVGHQRGDGRVDAVRRGDRALGDDDLAPGGDGVVERGGRDRLGGEVHADRAVDRVTRGGDQRAGGFHDDVA